MQAMPRSATLRPSRRNDWTGAVYAGGIAGLLAAIAIAAGWRGSDLPAQVFRVELLRRHGFVFWDAQWFSGHPTLSYSVLSPLFGALTGPVALGALCGVVSAMLFDRLVRSSFGSGAVIGSLWFAVATVTNLIVGRVTFGLGVTFALAAVYALSRGHPLIAIGAALLSGLASPVAGLFLAIACAAWGCARPGIRIVAWTAMAAAFVPVLVIAVVFPSPGAQPYEWWALGCDLAICVAALVVVPRRYAALRWAAAIYAVVLIATKLVETPLGGNVSRLNQYAAGPLLACVLWEYRRQLVVLLAIPFVFWQWFPTTDAILRAPSDPSTHRAYYQPLVNFLTANRIGFGRVEIPVTYRHWESAYVATEVPLARGWERQLDYAYAADFYDGTLTAAKYHDWLRSNGVAYVALPDTRLDASSHIEAEIIRRAPAYLEHVWTGPHWQVWRFTGFDGLVVGPATMSELNADSFVLDVRKPGAVTVRVHYSPRWAVDGDGCTVETPDGWTRIKNLLPGPVEVSQALRGTRCDGDQV
jgi:hypothetical protein